MTEVIITGFRENRIWADTKSGNAQGKSEESGFNHAGQVNAQQGRTSKNRRREMPSVF
jgi:hypothetical protein